MSRVGKKPIEIPKEAKISIKGVTVHVEGPKGKLQYEIPQGLSCRVEDSKIIVDRSSETKRQKSLHGLFRSLIANAVQGVTTGFSKDLEITGIGYKAQLQGKQIVLSLGYSHPVNFTIPEGIDVKIDKQTKINISGFNKQKVGQVAAEIKSLRLPDVYKGKGIRYAGEVIRKKVGKTGA
jgi:large subunit ribosomal protein L6